MFKLKKGWALLLLLCGLLLLPSAGANALPTQQLTILHTNDFHDKLLPIEWVDDYFFTEADQPVGGMARRAYVIKQIREAVDNPVALVDAGDLFAWGPWYFRYLGEPEVAAMNLLGYDAMAVGNHDMEDWNGYWSLNQMLTLAEASSFSWLGANITNNDTGERFSQIPPYIIKDYNGFKVGFLGLTTQDYAASRIPECAVSDPYAEAAYWVPIARQECDVLIAVTHLGYWEDCNLAGTVSGIDAIIGGHSHDFTEAPTMITNPDGKQVAVVTAGCDGVLLGWLDLTFEDDGGWQLADAQEQLIPLSNAVSDDPEMAALIDSYVNSPMNGPLATATQMYTIPEIDGNLGEWQGLAATDLGTEGSHYRALGDWTGPDDCHATAWLGWDVDYLYFAADVTDDVFIQGKVPESIWENDSIQIALDPLLDRIGGRYADDDREYWFAYENGETISYCYHGEIWGERPDLTAIAKLKDDGSGWTLEVALPWEELGVTPAAAPEMGFSWLVNDSDSGDFESWLEWTPGIAVGTDPNAFGQLTLEGAEDLPHTLSLDSSANPSSVASGGDTQLSAIATDSKGHAIATWAWSDNGAGGTFSPSAAVQDPIYTAPGNQSEAPISRYLTVTATCAGDPQISAAAGMYLIEDCAAHEITVTASANPSTLASGGTTHLSASAEDSFDHGIATWAWSDNGAGGSFLPNAEVQNPTWTAPGNYSGHTIARHLTVTVTCDGEAPISDSAQVYVNESSSSHYITVSASATPGVIASGGSTSLRASASDSSKHTIATWAWSDNGAGGTFSPSAEVQYPTYTAPGNDTQASVSRLLTVTATCSQGVSSSGLVSVTENPAPHGVTVTVIADPASIASGGETQLSAEAQDNYGYDIATWSWSDNGAGGTFSPSAAVKNPTYTGPGSTSLTLRQLTVTATCDDASAVSGTGEISVWEGNLSDSALAFSTAGTYLFSLPAKNPDRVDGRWVLRDLLSDPDAVVGHTDPGTGDPVQIATWSAVAQAYTYGTLDDLFSPGQGYFMEVDGPCAITLSGVPFELYNYVQADWNLLGAPSVAVDIRSLASTDLPTSGPWSWNATLQDYAQSYLLEPGLGYWIKFPSAGTIGSLIETTALMSSSLSSGEKPYLENAATLMAFSDVPAKHWAYAGIMQMRWLGVTGGSTNDNALNKTGKVTPVKTKTSFKPTGSITRGQLAVFLCRAFDLPLSAAPQLNYTDISSNYWAASYIEAVTKLGIMGEYPGKPGYFYAKKKVTRAELAAALARAAGLPLPDPVPVIFSDVTSDHWAASAIAALAARGVLAGDPSLSTKFGPTKPASRAQLAFYLDKLLNEVK